jgi:flagellin
MNSFFFIKTAESPMSLSILSSYDRLSKAMNKLTNSTNSPLASDDPAGLMISEQMKAQIASLNQRIENTTLTIARYETADAYAGQARSILTDIRVNAIAASNTATLDSTSQAALNEEAARLRQAYNDVISSAEFNGGQLLDGSAGTLANIPQLGEIDVTTAEGAQAAVELADSAALKVDSVRVRLGAAVKNDLSSSRSSMEVAVQNLQAAQGPSLGDFMAALMEFMKEIRQIQIDSALEAHSNLAREQVFALLRSKP